MRHFIFFFFISFFLLESCNTMYVPATPSTPVFAKGNSFKINTTLGASGLNGSVDYSPLNHYYLGGEAQGMRLMPLDSNHHLNVGGHVGYYFSPGDEDSHLNFQIGYTYGTSHYADVFDSTESHLYSASSVYATYHIQAFYVHDFRETKFFGFGLRYDLFRGTYTDIRSKFFVKSVPEKTSLPMAFVFFEYPFGRNSPWNLNAFTGVQLSTAQISDKNVSQDVPGFYTYFVFRVGIAYQLHSKK
jgi:hypothetical protein